MESYIELLNRRIKEYEEENKILWNAVRNVALAQTLGEARTHANDAIDATCPFLPLMNSDVTQPTEEVRRAS